MALASAFPGTSDIPKGADGSPLEGLTNIVGQFLNPAQSLHHSLPKSAVGLNRAAVVTFQTWRVRAGAGASIEGLLLGSDVKGRLQCHRLVCATSLGDMWNNQKVEKVCQQEGLVAAGIVISGDPSQEEVIATRDKWLRKLSQRTKRQDSLCVVVSGLHSMWKGFCLQTTFLI